MRSAALLIAALLASPASAFNAANNLSVMPAGGDDFVIPYQGPGRATAFWCAAGDYVIRGLGQPPHTRVYRISEPPRRSGDAVRFSLHADGAASRTGITLLAGKDGGSRSAAAAQSDCEFSFKSRR